jgi:hypothetical protein
MTSGRMILWGVALVFALGVLVSREIAPAQLIARGSESESAAILLERRFGERIRVPSDGRGPAAPGVMIAALATGVLGVSVAGGPARARVAVGCATAVGALCSGGLVVLLGLGGPAGVMAAISAASCLLLSLRAWDSGGRSALAPFVSLLFYLGVAVADIPALRSPAAAAAAGTVAGWAAAISLGPVIALFGEVRLGSGRGAVGLRQGRRLGPVARAAALTALAALGVGAWLRPLPLEAADVAAPAGFHIVIRDPEGFRRDGFRGVYELARALQKQEGVEKVESIATFVPEATLDQAQNFFLSPLGTGPSEGLIAGSDVTRLVLRVGVAPGSQAARAIVERARALADETLPGRASALVGGRAASLVDVRGALLYAYWGLALALVPAWFALRLLGRGARGALEAVGLAALAASASLGLNALLPNTSPPSRLAPGIALTVAATIAGAVAAATRPESGERNRAVWEPIDRSGNPDQGLTSKNL